MISPFICYTISFVCVIVVYLLGWSELYPKLSATLLIFLATSFVVHMVCHFRLKPIYFRKPGNERLPLIGTTIFIYILWTVEFIYDGGIPLLKILLRLPYNYRMFGVPSLHVFVVTFSSFFTIYLFHLYVSKRSKRLLMLYLINLAAALLIYNRGMLFFNIAGSLFVYLMSLKKLPYKKLPIIVAIIVTLFFLFGVLGTLRVTHEARQVYNNENFMDTGKASKAFRNSIIPKEYFWSYIYISSPLANLQNNINRNVAPDVTAGSLFWTVVYECLPDFITKRIHTLRNTAPAQSYSMGTSFNVGTIYLGSYSYSSWGGMILMCVFLLIFPWVFLKALDQQSDFFVTGWAILCTMYFFSSFDNTLAFTGLSFQLVYPVLLSFYEKYFHPKK